MSNVMDIVEDFKKAQYAIETLNKNLEWIENNFNYKKATEEERSFVTHLKTIAFKPFDETSWRLDSMLAPNRAQGKLFKNSDGRYEIEGTDIYFNCGALCEVYLPYSDFDEDGEYMTWIPTAIEYDHGKLNRYYFTTRPEVLPDGILVRVKNKS